MHSILQLLFCSLTHTALISYLIAYICLQFFASVAPGVVWRMYGTGFSDQSTLVNLCPFLLQSPLDC